MPVTKVVRENAIEAYLVKRVGAIGGKALKLQGPRGFPDRTLFLPGGRTIVVEVKKPKRYQVAKHQMQWLHTLQWLGIEVAIVYTTDDVDELLRGLT